MRIAIGGFCHGTNFFSSVIVDMELLKKSTVAKDALLKAYTGAEYELQVYTEHSMQEQGSGSVAAAYIGIRDRSGHMSWGAGTDTDIIHASANALVSAFNNMK